MNYEKKISTQLSELRTESKRSQEKAKNIKVFLYERAETPKYICVCCEGLFFYYSVRIATREEIEKLAPEQSKFTTLKICSTCHNQFRKNPNSLPTLAVKNGLEFPNVPNCVRNLSSLEERIVSPIINFMQLKDLTPFSLNSQLGINGSIVNIPVNVPEMVNILPRSSNNMLTIQLKLKRRLEYKSNYMFESIRQSAILEALEHLINTPLYRENEITIDECSMQNYAKNSGLINFIIESDDEQALIEA